MRAATFFLAAACCRCLLAQTAPEILLEQKTLRAIESLDNSLDGVLGVAAIDLTTGRTLAYHGDAVLAQASLIKIPILVRAFQAVEAKEIRLDAKVALAEKDAVGGSGALGERLAKAPVEMTFLELLTLMIRDSDNTATNKVISLVRMDRVNALMDTLRLPNTRLRRVMMDSAAARRDDENTSTPVEMARLVELIYRGKAVSPAASKEMISLLSLVKADFRAALPPGVRSASKPGEIPGVHTEAGIVYLEGRPYVLSVMSAMLAGDANPIRDVVGIVHAHYIRLAASNRYGHRVR
jgi:beta-lactamase class A